MKEINGFSDWQFGWGVPRGLFVESEGRKLEIAFVLAILFHALPFGLLWHKQEIKKAEQVITLQNVELMEPESELPPAQPVVEVQKPKSALDFLKMAIPVFRKPAPEIPRDVIPIAKPQEPKLLEPEKLIDKKMIAQAAPQIKLDSRLDKTPPPLMELAKLPSQKASQTRMDPALKLEEVGRRAVAPPPIQAPSISMDRSALKDRPADIGSAPQIARMPTRSASEKLVERTAPVGYKQPSAPLGYERRGGGGSVSLDQPREVVRAPPKAQPAIPQVVRKDTSDKIEISRDKVKITGPLSSRQVVTRAVPVYPAWARARNIEADVAIRFTVSAAGEVREQVVVERTSGFPELDKLAMDAIKKWQFSKLAQGGADQWGVVTFRFLLE